MIDTENNIKHRFMVTLLKLEVPKKPKKSPNIIKAIKLFRELGFTLRNVGICMEQEFDLKHSKDYIERWWPGMWNYIAFRISF